MRNILIAAILVTSFLAYAAEPSRHVYLRSSGALEQLARDNPTHHAKVERIIAEVRKQPMDSVPRWMKAEFGAEDVSYPPTLLTSYPAKKYIHFKLDDISYTAVVVQSRIERLIPAARPAR